MLIKWGSKFETGNDAVDFQHRYFFDLINRIEENLKQSTDEEYKQLLILELAKYADFHFTSEENLAKSLSLTGVGRHHELHTELLDQFTDNSNKLATGEMSYKDFFQFLIEWLVGHTYYEDQQLFKKENDV